VDNVREGVRAVLEWSLADEEWDFQLAEQSFGDERGWGAVVLEQEGTRVALRGRIDRVDVGHASGAVRVIDYKTRERSAEDHTAAFGKTTFQLAIYGRAAQATLDRGRAEGLYLPVQRLRPGGAPKKHAERWADAHALEGGTPSFERTVLALIDDVRLGRVGVVPASSASCDHCDYDGVCRKPRFAPAAPMDDDESNNGGEGAG
jgi:PD-(D/E)XK nuclease superfamily